MAQKRHSVRRAKYVVRSKREQRHERGRTEVRACCSTNWREPHRQGCVRSDRCRDKVAYAERETAERAVTQRTATTGGGVLSTYRCPDCRLFHIGHPLPGQRGWDEAAS